MSVHEVNSDLKLNLFLRCLVDIARLAQVGGVPGSIRSVRLSLQNWKVNLTSTSKALQLSFFFFSVTELRKVTISFVMSARLPNCLFEWNNSAPTGPIFGEIWYLSFENRENLIFIKNT